MGLSLNVLVASVLGLGLLVQPAPARTVDTAGAVSALLDEAEALPPLEAVLIAHRGTLIAERGYRGHSPTAPTAIMSASKSVMSALVGIAIDRGVLEGTDQRIAPLLATDLPANPDPRLREITVGHLLSMQAGLGATSGAQYGAWVNSPNWVRSALARPFEGAPGGRMIYSTGSTHLLSAILARQTGRSTLELARDWLGPLEGFRIASWARDPQGIHVGGNLMSMSPRSLLAFGELYRTDGIAPDGTRILPEGWVAASFAPRTRSPWSGELYGYGWFRRETAGVTVHYGWGYGGQMIYVVPELELTVAMTSDDGAPSVTGHREALHDLLAGIIRVVAAAQS